LEHGAFRLVREALSEREVLLRTAPHVVRPMRFVLPVAPGLRSRAMLRVGLFLYDTLGARKILPPARHLDLAADAAGQPLQPQFRNGYEYSDCKVDDARLVILNALDATERGAAIRTRTRVVAAERGADWRLTFDAQEGRGTATARVLVNAAGPWVGEVARNVLGRAARPPLRLAKGSHIVVPKLFDHDRGYILQNDDRRVVFALPYAGDFTLIGTTDENYTGPLDAVAPTARDVDYLCRAVGRYFRTSIRPEQVVRSFAGVRSLYDESAGADAPEDVTRDYRLILDEGDGFAPVLTVYGGKITTGRRLAEDALARLSRYFSLKPGWTTSAPLPGGDFAWNDLSTQVSDILRVWPFLSESEAQRLVGAYGTRVKRFLTNAKRREDIAPFFGPLSAAEVRYLMAHEWARTPDDVLWRRSHLGLVLAGMEKEALARFMAEAIVAQP
jgi:glycerol-3-phosphate dehydrogenase